MKICLVVYAPQKGLLASLGKELEARGHEVCFAVRDRNVETAIRRHFPGLGEDGLANMADLGRVFEGDVASQCLRREEQYGETFAMLVSHDRGLGKGYLCNVQGYPPVIKAWWHRDRKYAEVLTQFQRYETAMDRLRPEMVLGVAMPKPAHLVCRARGIAVRILTPPRFGSLYRWTVDETEHSSALVEALRRRLDELSGMDELPLTELEQTAFAQHFFATYRYDYFSALKQSLRRVPREVVQLLRGTHKRFSGGYEFLGWCAPLLRKPGIFRYFMRHGVRPEDLEGNRVVLFPLHAEPETSLLSLSPELNNSMELVTWVSKCLPADATLVVKEHPDSFGLRPRWYYDNLRRMANVVLAHPHVHGKEWIARCALVANITSTMGFEAVAMERPVLSFGAYQVINHLPTVEYADSFTATRRALGRLLGLCPDRARQLQISRVALDTAFKDVCFDLAGYESIFGSLDLHQELALKALDALGREFPELASGRTGNQQPKEDM